jgi:hypothetical protein
MFQGDYPGSNDSHLTVVGYCCITEITIPCGVQKEVCNINYQIEEIHGIYENVKQICLSLGGEKK